MNPRFSRAFTLVELLVVMMVAGVIGAAFMVFFKPAVDAYFDASRRAKLTDLADTALRRMGRDVRSAVPNSIRSPGNLCFELVPTSMGGRYRKEADTVNDSGPGCAPSSTCSAPLDLSQPTTAFDVLSPLASFPAPGDWVVIGNQNTNDVYMTSSPTRAQIASTSATDFGTRRMSIASTQFLTGYDGGRFTVVPNNGGKPAVFYVCENPGVDGSGNGAGTLYRLSRGFVETYPSACPATAGAAIVATRVRSCNFIYSPNLGETQQSGFVWMELEIAEAGESISLSFGAHVDNAP